jgi:hypothetical protein
MTEISRELTDPTLPGDSRFSLFPALLDPMAGGIPASWLQDYVDIGISLLVPGIGGLRYGEPKLMLSFRNSRPHPLVLQELELLFESSGKWLRVFSQKGSRTVGATGGDFVAQPMSLLPEAKITRAALCVATQSRHASGTVVGASVLRAEQSEMLVNFRAPDLPEYTFSTSQSPCAEQLAHLLPGIEAHDADDVAGLSEALPHAPVAIAMGRAYHGGYGGATQFHISLTLPSTPRALPPPDRVIVALAGGSDEENLRLLARFDQPFVQTASHVTVRSDWLALAEAPQILRACVASSVAGSPVMIVSEHLLRRFRSISAVTEYQLVGRDPYRMTEPNQACPDFQLAARTAEGGSDLSTSSGVDTCGQVKGSGPGSAEPAGAAGPDILGITLGMSFADADRLIRSSMEVGRVLTADRARQSGAVLGALDPYTSGCLYISSDESEAVAIFNEPPAAPNRVVAAWRQVQIPGDAAHVAALVDRLRDKYGAEGWSATGYIEMAWGQIDFGRQRIRCLGRMHQQPLAKIWHGDQEGPRVAGTAGSTVRRGTERFPALAMSPTADFGQGYAVCGPAVGARLDSRSTQAADLVVWLVDHRSYAELLAESRRLVESGEAAIGDVEDVDVDLKL